MRHRAGRPLQPVPRGPPMSGPLVRCRGCGSPVTSVAYSGRDLASICADCWAGETPVRYPRRCTRCHQTKPLESEFGINRRDPHGRQTRCRACQQEVNRQKRLNSSQPQINAPLPKSPGAVPVPDVSRLAQVPQPPAPIERPETGASPSPGAARILSRIPTTPPPQARPATAGLPSPVAGPAAPGETPRAAA